EFPRAAEKGRVALRKLAYDRSVAGRKRLTVILVERRLGVERVDLTGSSDHEEKDDRLRFGGKVRGLRRQRIDAIGGACWRIEQRCEGQRTEAMCGADQDVAAGHCGAEVFTVHRETRSG